MGARGLGGGCKSLCEKFRAAVAVAFLAAAPFTSAWADVLSVVAGGTVLRDSNIFKQSTGVEDTTKSAYAGLRLDVPYSLQRLQIDVTRTAYRHNLSFLDFDGTDYRGALLWNLTPRISGAITADRSEAQVPFLDFQGTEKNIRRIRNEAFTVDGLLGYGIHVIGSASDAEQISSVPFLQQADYRMTRIEGGLKYVLRTGNSISIVQRTGRGTYINRAFDPLVPLDTGFKQNETELQATFLFGGRSTFAGRLTRVERRHEHFSEFDSSGYSGELKYAWNATGKLNLGMLARRDFVPYFDVSVTHRIDKSIGITPRLQATDHVSLSAGFNRTQSDFLGTTPPGGTARKDTFNVVDLGLVWTPRRALSLTGGFQRARRASNDPIFAFDGKITSLSASLTF